MTLQLMHNGPGWRSIGSSRSSTSSDPPANAFAHVRNLQAMILLQSGYDTPCTVLHRMETLVGELATCVDPAPTSRAVVTTKALHDDNVLDSDLLPALDAARTNTEDANGDDAQAWGDPSPEWAVGEAWDTLLEVGNELHTSKQHAALN